MKHGQRRENNIVDLVNVYVANLGAYTRGELKGQWLSLPTSEEEINNVINEVLGNDEEYAIHDYETDLGLTISEYENIHKLNELLNEVEECQVELLGALIRNYGYNLEEAINKLDDVHYIYLEKNIFISDNENLAYSIIDNIGGLECTLGERVSNYFDYEAFGHDLRYDLDIILGDMEEEEREYYYNMSNYDLADWYIDGISIEELGEGIVERYFDYEAFGRDLSFDYTIDHETMIATCDY